MFEGGRGLVKLDKAYCSVQASSIAPLLERWAQRRQRPGDGVAQRCLEESPVPA